MMKKPEVKNNKNGQNGKKKGPHKKQGGVKAVESYWVG
jgi:hypothetical protein